MATTLYLVCATLGGVLLVSSLIADADHDGHDPTDGNWFSLRGATYFLGFFGFTGLALGTFTEAPAYVVAGSASFVGLAAAALAAWVIDRMMAENRAGGGTLKSADMIGREATVLVAFEAEGTGRLAVNDVSSHLELLCRGDDEGFAEGEQVLIVDVAAGVATVTKLKGSA